MLTVFLRDLTIMPGATLIIERNVEVHVWPNVRILVLGDLIADGTLWQPIRFKPINTTEYAEQHGRVGTRYRRLALNRINTRRAEINILETAKIDDEDKHDSLKFWNQQNNKRRRNVDTLWWKRYRRRDKHHDIDARFVSYRNSVNKNLIKNSQK